VGTHTNIPNNQAKDVGRNNRKNQFDQLAKSLQTVLKGNSEKDKDTDGIFYGYVLYEHPLELTEFKARFQSNKKFYDSVIGEDDKDTLEASNTAHIKEIYVEIPQITDFLPRPDLSVLMDLIKYKSELDTKSIITPTAEAKNNKNSNDPTRPTAKKDNAATILSSFEETINIISMYPKVYRYCSNNQACGLGTACKVYIPSAEDKLLPTMAYGIYKKQIGGATKIDGVSPIRAAMDNLIKINKK
tara:strand:+ start:848 stop:1579 length:732 start_codon:yes stop_codon:yes gene_type:complete